MDLTLFIVIVIALFAVFYGISVLSDLRNDIKTITGGNKDDNNMRSMVDKVKNGLEYLKEFL